MSTKLVRGERRCAVGVEHDGSTMFAQYVRADWADDQIKQLVALVEGFVEETQFIKRLGGGKLDRLIDESRALLASLCERVSE